MRPRPASSAPTPTVLIAPTVAYALTPLLLKLGGTGKLSRLPVVLLANSDKSQLRLIEPEHEPLRRVRSRHRDRAFPIRQRIRPGPADDLERQRFRKRPRRLLGSQQ